MASLFSLGEYKQVPGYHVLDLDARIVISQYWLCIQ